MVDTATGVAPGNILDATISDSERNIFVELTNSPTCMSYLPNQVEFSAYIINPLSQTYNFLTTYAYTDPCPSTGFCGRITSLNGQGTISILINGDANFVGLNLIFIQTTVKAFDSSGSIITSTYNSETVFELHVTSVCSVSDFTSTRMVGYQS